ncbi:MAG TPA: FtsW/RodA/SpoVE family cell cycle protein [Caulifigura sp.]|jgi:cell division protein FtsW (lipid II flippase)|nr:FtsW/RodA/SpoVE family cell cycle protein [Caulifigura sp.]
MPLLSRLPWFSLLAAVLLVLAGLAGIARGDDLYGGSPMLIRQLVWVAISTIVFLAATAVPYRRLRSWAYPSLLAAVLLLVLVLLMPARNGSRSWFALGPFTFQPSEFAKLAYVLALSRWLISSRRIGSLRGLIVPVLMTLPPLVLILREPDLGTASIFVPVLFAMLFAAGAKTWHLAAVVIAGMVALPSVWTELSAEQKSRITAVFRQRDGGAPARGDDYHLHQSKQVIALGGVWGSDLAGMPLAEAEAYHLPAARTDFVFCLVSERWGMAGATGVLAAYFVLVAGALRIGANTDDPFGRLICVGIATWLGTQVVINAGMTVGLVPITGITLPLLSYGGSSMVATCAGIGLVINVSLRPGFEVRAPFSLAAAG